MSRGWERSFMSWRRERDLPEWESQREPERPKPSSSGANVPSWRGFPSWDFLMLRMMAASVEGELLCAQDGRLIAVCPACGAGEIIEPIPVIGHFEGEATLYLGCSACGCPFHVTGPILVEADGDAE